jgi:ribonuclease J
MKITPYGGAGEIGGNKILLEAGNARIFLDFGVPFDRGKGIYSGFDFVVPRDKLGLKDYFEFNMVPQIEGLYSKNALRYTQMRYRQPEFNAILISHIHRDHFGDAADIDPEIPVYIGHGAKKLNDAFNTIYPNFKSEANGNVMEFSSGKSFRIMDIEVTPVHVDHSIPGAYGFIIKTREGTVASMPLTKFQPHLLTRIPPLAPSRER